MRDFGKIGNETAHLYEIKGRNGLRAQLTEYGATLVALYVPDENGNEIDVVCGYDTAEEYQAGQSYFGATVGRHANRIANAKCIIDGVEVTLEQNDNENNLHSGSNGLSKRMWTVKEEREDAITFSILDNAFSDDFPGNLQAEVTYEVTDQNALMITYHAVSDADTVCNFTNHSYFNLNGHNAGNVYKHKVILNANEFTPDIDSKAIPNGRIVPVNGSVFDFRSGRTIGMDIESDDPQLKFVRGYDHNFVIDQSKPFVAQVFADQTKIAMEMQTDLPGVQLYTANYVDGEKGKAGAVYQKRCALCLESQYFPNSVNQENFKSAILKKGEEYHTTTSYRFFLQE